MDLAGWIIVGNPTAWRPDQAATALPSFFNRRAWKAKRAALPTSSWNEELTSPPTMEPTTGTIMPARLRKLAKAMARLTRSTAWSTTGVMCS